MEEIINGVGTGIIQLIRLGIGLFIIKIAMHFGRERVTRGNKPKWESIIVGLFGCAAFAISANIFLNNYTPTNTEGVFGVHYYESEPPLPPEEYWNEDLHNYEYPEVTIGDHAKTLTFMFSITFIPFLYGLNKGEKINNSD